MMQGTEAVGQQVSSPRLICPEIVRARFSSVLYSESHGCLDGTLGVGYLYYGMVAALQARVVVCIGSGGGFVPDLLAQVQRDQGNTEARTILIDAVLPERGWGSPLQPRGWLTPDNDFLRRATDVTVLRMLSAQAAQRLRAEHLRIDYLHIDGDHSTAGVLADFADFSPMVRVGGIISLHDLHLAEVRLAIARIRATYPGWEYLSFGEIGAGTAFFRRLPPPPPSRVETARRAFSTALAGLGRALRYGLVRGAAAGRRGCRQVFLRHPKHTALDLLRACRLAVLRFPRLSAVLLRALRRQPWLHEQVRRIARGGT